MPDAIMIFAAGFGTRMGALTAHRPKPLIEVAGRTLLDHALALTDAVKLSRRVVNAHYLGDQIAAHLQSQADIAVLNEAPDLLDTGGGLRHALGDLGPGPVFTLNSDAVWTGPNPLLTLRAAWQPARMDALLLTVPPKRANGRRRGGDFTLTNRGRLERGGDAVYTGAQILKTDRIAARTDSIFSLNEIWDEMARDGRLFGAVHPGCWCDVGHPEGIAEAEAMLRAARVNAP
ncbi:MAG: nucleotidyltransferase family protein [Pseudomonadota bacterium]